MTATKLRQELYKVLGRLADSGGSVTITHRGQKFYMVPEAKQPLMERLVPHDTLLVDPDEIVNSDASAWDWNEERNLDALS